jgi:Zn finger protein HypA/HybF involved in hydrogenase expression
MNKLIRCLEELAKEEIMEKCKLLGVEKQSKDVNCLQTHTYTLSYVVK